MRYQLARQDSMGSSTYSCMGTSSTEQNRTIYKRNMKTGPHRNSIKKKWKKKKKIAKETRAEKDRIDANHSEKRKREKPADRVDVVAKTTFGEGNAAISPNESHILMCFSEKIFSLSLSNVCF